MLYDADADDEHARLCSAAGIAAGHHAAPVMCELDGALWPLADVLRTHAPQVVDCTRLPCTLPTGAWDVPPTAGDRADRSPQTGSADRGVWLVAGLNPYRLLDAGYRRFLDLVAGQVAREHRQRAGLRGGAPPRRGAGRARSREDRVLQQHQPRIPHAAHADARRRSKTRSRGTQARCAGDDLAIGAPQLRCACCKLVNALLDFSRIEAGRVQARYEPVDLGAVHRRAGRASSARRIERAGLRLEVDVPTLLVAGLRRSRDVGEDRPQPALERVQVHLRRAASAWRLRAVGDATSSWPSTTPASASRRTSCRACSSASTASGRARRARTRAPASAWRWCRSW